jgi:hypothetical protein
MRYRIGWPIWAISGVLVACATGIPLAMIPASDNAPVHTAITTPSAHFTISATMPPILTYTIPPKTPAVPKRLPRQVRPVHHDRTNYVRPKPSPSYVPPAVYAYYSCSMLEHLWDSVGGNPAAAFVAAEIATAESGGRASAISPTNDYGLWQINGTHGALASLDPIANARAAVIISGNGSNWSPWTTFVSGAYIGRCLWVGSK